jgi:hypothetical protein
MSDMDSIKTTTIRLLGRDRHTFRKNVVDWQEEIDDLALSESEALNAAVILINQAANIELAKEDARKRGISEKDMNLIENGYTWFMDQYIRILKDVVAARNQSDKRRSTRTS